MSRTLQRVLVAVVSLAVTLAPFATGAAVAEPACGVKRGHWTTVPAPPFPKGPQQLVAYEVDAGAPARMFVTNGVAVMRTVDGACTWKPVFVLPDVPTAESQATAINSEILEIEIAPRLRTRTVLRIAEDAVQGSRPHVVLSDDGGESWRSGDAGLPPAGAPEDLLLHPADPQHAYLLVDIGGGSVDSLFASSDGGQTWTLRTGPASLASTTGIIGLEPDPLVASALWAYGPGGLYRSQDSGASFDAVGEFSGSRVSTVDVFHARGPARIAAFRPDQRDLRASDDDGATWLSIATPPNVTSSATADSANALFVTADGRVWAYHAPSFSWLDLNAPSSGLRDISTDLGGDVYAMSSSSIEVVTPPGGRLPVPLPDDVFDVPLVNPPPKLQRHPPTLRPNGKKVLLDPGESRRVSYKLGLPERPLPLNVFFLLDTSDSMGATIGDLAQSVAEIVNQLNTEKLDLKVGIGAFRAYPDSFPPRPRCDEAANIQGQCERNYVFLRVLDIVEPGPFVSNALETLESDAGGFYKSHLGALYQLATGEGQDLFPPGPGGHDVPSGLQANFDDNSLRIVIHATDEAFGDDVERNSGGTDRGNPQPPEIPEFSEVAAAFKARGIMQVGLSIGRSPRRDLERVARDTGAFAPAVGVDCGRGYFIPAGEPLVCPVQRNNLTQAHNLVPAIVNILKAVPDSADVSLAVKGNDRIIQKVTPEVHEDVVLQVARGLSFDVTYRCPADLAGKRFDIDVASRSEGDVLDSVATRVVCRAVPERPPVPPVPPLVAVGVAVAVPPPPPPPVSNLTSASQAQSQAQAQAGAAFQEEQEPEVAIAAAYREAMQEENIYELEMVAYEARREQVSPLLTLGAGAVMASLFYAGMMMSRQRARLVFQRQRSRR